MTGVASASCPVVGCDVQDVADVREAIDVFGDRYLDRVFSRAERALGGPGDVGFYARRFAGKEAVIKLIGDGDGVDLRGIEILAGPSGRPEVRLSGTAATRAERDGLRMVEVSLSSSGGIAMAVATGLTTGRQPFSSSTGPFEENLQ